MVHQISPAPLTFEVIEEIFSRNSRLELSAESVALIEKSKAYLDRKIREADGPLYGITPGFGALCDITVSKSDLSKPQENLVLSNA